MEATEILVSDEHVLGLPVFSDSFWMTFFLLRETLQSEILPVSLQIWFENILVDQKYSLVSFKPDVLPILQNPKMHLKTYGSVKLGSFQLVNCYILMRSREGVGIGQF